MYKTIYIYKYIDIDIERYRERYIERFIVHNKVRKLQNLHYTKYDYQFDILGLFKHKYDHTFPCFLFCVT